MSGSEIDHKFLKQRQEKTEVLSHCDHFTLSAEQVIEWIYTHQDKYPAARNLEEAKLFLKSAAMLISCDVDFLHDEADKEMVKVYNHLDCCEHFFRGFHRFVNAMSFIKDTIFSDCLNMKLRGLGDRIDPEEDQWSVLGLMALCSPLETNDNRSTRFQALMGGDVND